MEPVGPLRAKGKPCIMIWTSIRDMQYVYHHISEAVIVQICKKSSITLIFLGTNHQSCEK